MGHGNSNPLLLNQWFKYELYHEGGCRGRVEGGNGGLALGGSAAAKARQHEGEMLGWHRLVASVLCRAAVLLRAVMGGVFLRASVGGSPPPSGCDGGWAGGSVCVCSAGARVVLCDVWGARARARLDRVC
jgi:hypothetical protein